MARNNLSFSLSQLYHYLLIFLKRLPKLEYLSLEENPVTREKEYRLFVIAELPKLKFLDWKEISKEERAAAEKIDWKAVKDELPESSVDPMPAPSSPSVSFAPSFSAPSSQSSLPSPTSLPVGSAPPKMTKRDTLQSLDNILSELEEERRGVEAKYNISRKPAGSLRGPNGSVYPLPPDEDAPLPPPQSSDPFDDILDILGGDQKQAVKFPNYFASLIFLIFLPGTPSIICIFSSREPASTR
jgi:hypothetical protein